MTEVREVLGRPETHRKFPTLTPDAVNSFLLVDDAGDLDEFDRPGVGGVAGRRDPGPSPGEPGSEAGPQPPGRPNASQSIRQNSWRRPLDVVKHAIAVTSTPRTFSLPRDPKDEPYINLALAAGAAYLVSRDRDLLDLMDDRGFRRQFPALIILDPVAFLRRLANDSGPGPDPIGD